MDRKLQRHRADSLRQHGFLVYIDNVHARTIRARYSGRERTVALKISLSLKDKNCR